LIKSLRKAGHYIGAHSDRHLLYCSWEDRSKTLVTRDSFETDLKNNYREMETYAVLSGNARFYLPPYEWYNAEISQWTRDLGLTLINHTGGTLSAADYTIPSMGERYRPSDEILSSILTYAREDPNGLNGFILLMHIGTHPERTEKFHLFLPELISTLKTEGYQFKRVDELLGDLTN
jgi:peptidoglycan/xylan/chitin deacetylase (PgdA/CDA1 family)